MHPLDPIARLALFGASNLAHNLQFIPADRLDWKPAPTAKSALEIVHHAAGALLTMKDVLAGRPYEWRSLEMPADLDAAQELIRRAGREYATALCDLDPATLDREVPTFRGMVPLNRAMIMPVFDVVHHHGQIAYIQTLLGDEENHFER